MIIIQYCFVPKNFDLAHSMNTNHYYLLNLSIDILQLIMKEYKLVANH